MSILTRLLVTVSLALISSTAYSSSLTVYEALGTYGFPVGILPKGIALYELDPATGKFAVHLNNSCSFSISGYDLNYKTKITGTISKDKIKNLTGIQVKVLFFWVNIIEVTKDDYELELSVGIASADFPLDNFFESPQCGCGFDCNGVGTGKFSFKRLPNLPLLDV